MNKADLMMATELTAILSGKRVLGVHVVDAAQNGDPRLYGHLTIDFYDGTQVQIAEISTSGEIGIMILRNHPMEPAVEGRGNA